MQLETKASSRPEHDLTLLSLPRRRIRTQFWLLQRQAKRRTHVANTMVLLSCLAVLALVKVFYDVLSR